MSAMALLAIGLLVRTVVNGWLVMTKTGLYGTDYLTRAVVTLVAGAFALAKTPFQISPRDTAAAGWLRLDAGAVFAAHEVGEPRHQRRQQRFLRGEVVQ